MWQEGMNEGYDDDSRGGWDFMIILLFLSLTELLSTFT